MKRKRRKRWHGSVKIREKREKDEIFKKQQKGKETVQHLIPEVKVKKKVTSIYRLSVVERTGHKKESR